MKKKLIFLLACAILPVGCSGKRPAQLGTESGRLFPCPSSPNCVSSQSTKKSQYVEPISYVGELSTAKNQLIEVLNNMERTQIITQKENYIHAECTSALFRFVDDVEFYFDDTEKKIHVRSASRLGYSDLGANRKRVERIRNAFGIVPDVY